MGADAGRGCLAMEGLARNRTTEVAFGRPAIKPICCSFKPDGRCAPNAEDVTIAANSVAAKPCIRIRRAMVCETTFMICGPEAQHCESRVKEQPMAVIPPIEPRTFRRSPLTPNRDRIAVNYRNRQLPPKGRRSSGRPPSSVPSANSANACLMNPQDGRPVRPSLSRRTGRTGRPSYVARTRTLAGRLWTANRLARSLVPKRELGGEACVVVWQR